MNSNVTDNRKYYSECICRYFTVRGSTAYYDSVITIGQSGAGNIIQNFGASAVATTYGVYFIYVESPSVAYNTIDNAGGGGDSSWFYILLRVLFHCIR